MDFLPKHSVAGIFTPDQYAVVQSVYKDIVSQPWFSQSPEKQQKFAVSVIKAYRSGLVCHDELREHCLTTAKQHFMNYVAVMSELADASSSVGIYPISRDGDDRFARP